MELTELMVLVRSRLLFTKGLQVRLAHRLAALITSPLIRLLRHLAGLRRYQAAPILFIYRRLKHKLAGRLVLTLAYRGLRLFYLCRTEKMGKVLQELLALEMLLVMFTTCCHLLMPHQALLQHRTTLALELLVG
jgi:hypothetical protein